MKRVFVGRNDGKPLNKKISGIGRACLTRRFHTHDEAANFIGNIRDNGPAKDRKAVLNGEFYLDVPEAMLN